MKHNERKEPTFDTVHEVLGLARRLAAEDFERHLEAVRQAKSTQEREELMRGLHQATDRMALVEVAQKEFIQSESKFRTSTVHMLDGQEQQAQAGYAQSGASMQNAARNLDQFADRLPRSRFANAAIETVAKVDDVLGKAGQKAARAMDKIQERGEDFEIAAVRTVEGMARGIRSFAQSMVDFGRKIAEAPALIRDATKKKGTTLADATTSFALSVISSTNERMRQLGQAAGAVRDNVLDRVDAARIAGADQMDLAKMAVMDRVDTARLAVADRVDALREAERNARRSAWETLEHYAQASKKLASDVADSVEKKVDTVEQHGRATATVAKAAVSTASSLLKTLGGVVVDQYKTGLAQAADDQAQRKKGSQP